MELKATHVLGEAGQRQSSWLMECRKDRDVIAEELAQSTEPKVQQKDSTSESSNADDPTVFESQK
jgi:hypothetical protein